MTPGASETLLYYLCTIAQSHLGEKHDSIVVAIERNDELITLDKDTTFQLGDLVWIVGNREKIRKILYLT